LYFVSGRMWIAFTFSALIAMGLSVVHFFKMQFRGDPFIVTDIEFLREAGAIITAYTYSLTLSWRIYFAIAAFICGVLFSALFLKRKLEKIRPRAIASAVTIAICAVLYLAVYTNTEIYDTIVPETSEIKFSFTHNFAAKGFLYSFIHTMEGALAERAGRYPYWYDEQLARQMLASYAHADIPADRKVNIISIMLEAYVDLSRFGVLEFEVDVFGPLHRLQTEAVYGNLVTNVFAGGTIDTERLFLTGNTHLTNFRVPVNSFVHYLRNQGFHTEGLHVGDSWFYDRVLINRFLGFDEYFFLEDFEDSNRSDAFFFPKVMELYMARDRSRPYFSFNLSYQNHGPYDSARTSEPYLIARRGMSDESFNILNNYLTGIYDTGRRLEAFIDLLRDDPYPVVVVVFGDHMPWLGSAHSVYRELGIRLDRSTEEGFLNIYSTPYLIWANDAARDVTGNDFAGYGGSFSPTFLMGKLFYLLSWEGESYMQALMELKSRIDVINLNFDIFRENGSVTWMLSDEGADALRRLRMMEIYRLNNFEY